MSVEEAVRTVLTNTGAVTALISTRVYPLYLPPDTTLPAVAYERISTRRSYAHDGPQAPVTARIQYDSIATTLSAAMGVADAIRGALSGYTGTSAGVRIASCLLANEMSQEEKDTGYARVSQDFLVTFMEV
jgi:hypothetical protein